MLLKEESLLKETATSYPKGEGIKIRINNENYQYLTDQNGLCHEEKYYRRGKGRDSKASAGMYIKAVLEEYVRKPYLEREAIYYQEQINSLI